MKTWVAGMIQRAVSAAELAVALHQERNQHDRCEHDIGRFLRPMRRDELRFVIGWTML